MKNTSVFHLSTALNRDMQEEGKYSRLIAEEQADLRQKKPHTYSLA